MSSEPLPLLSQAVRAQVDAFLSSQSTLALATVGSEQTPQVAPLFFVHTFSERGALRVYWLSDPTSRHSANLDARSKAAVAVYAPVWEWREIRGVQMEGLAAPVHEVAEREHVLALYRAKFPFVTAVTFAVLVRNATLYALRVAWLRWLDNAQGFGHKREFRLPQ